MEALAEQTYKRKEVIGDATLYVGDCLPIMSQFENNEIDAVVTDPPYGLDDKWTGGGWFQKGVYCGKVEFDHSIPDLKYFIQIKRIARYQVVFGGNYFDLGKTRCLLVWNKPHFPTMADCEIAWTNLDIPAKSIYENRYTSSHKDGKDHPTQKPVKVMEWCIEQIKLEPTSTIIDPFMGSGTTGVACHRLGHKFIGIEQDEEYFDIACKRIETAQRQLRLFDA